MHIILLRILYTFMVIPHCALFEFRGITFVPKGSQKQCMPDSKMTSNLHLPQGPRSVHDERSNLFLVNFRNGEKPAGLLQACR